MRYRRDNNDIGTAWVGVIYNAPSSVAKPLRTMINEMIEFHNVRYATNMAIF
jgi:hypothetical protein